MTKALVVPSVVFASIVVLFGCGSNGTARRADPAPPTSVAEDGPRAGVGEPFATRARAVCAVALHAKQEWKKFPVAGFDPSQPDSAAFPQVAAWLETEVAPTFASWRADLTKLGTPPSARESWGDVLSAIDTIVKLNSTQVVAAKTGNAAAFARARDDLQAIQPELERATAAGGVPTCADVHK